MTADKPTTASQWVVRLNTGPWPPALQDELDKWLDENPRHQTEFEALLSVWNTATHLSDSVVARGELEKLQSFISLRSSVTFAWLFKRAVPAVAVVSALFLAVMQVITPATRDIPLLSNENSAATFISEIKHYELPDGSTVTMNADSTMYVQFDDSTRAVHLSRGEAFFEVKPEPGRPFIVSAGGHSVRVTGTKFNVNFTPMGGSLEVGVTEGHVNVRGKPSNDDAADSASLAPGDVVLMAEGKPSVRKRMPTSNIGAWRNGRLHFDHAALRDVLTDINRYTYKRFVIGDPQLADLVMSGSFRSGDTQSVLYSLQTLYDIRAEDAGDVWLLMKRTPDAARPTQERSSNP